MMVVCKWIPVSSFIFSQQSLNRERFPPHHITSEASDHSTNINNMSLFSLLEGMDGTEASVESKDYLDTKQQFQLHSLLTEQRHPTTWNLSADINRETLVGTTSLLRVDEDITQKFKEIAETKNQLQQLEKASLACEKAILNGHKIYVYGCGATGRLAKQCESSFWRPFWQKVPSEVKDSFFADIDNRCSGEITGRVVNDPPS